MGVMDLFFAAKIMDDAENAALAEREIEKLKDKASSADRSAQIKARMDAGTIADLKHAQALKDATIREERENVRYLEHTAKSANDRNAELEKEIEKERKIAEGWMLQQAAFREMAIQFGFQAGKTPDQIDESASELMSKISRGDEFNETPGKFANHHVWSEKNKNKLMELFLHEKSVASPSRLEEYKLSLYTLNKAIAGKDAGVIAAKKRICRNNINRIELFEDMGKYIEKSKPLLNNFISMSSGYDMLNYIEFIKESEVVKGNAQFEGFLKEAELFCNNSLAKSIILAFSLDEIEDDLEADSVGSNLFNNWRSRSSKISQGDVAILFAALKTASEVDYGQLKDNSLVTKLEMYDGCSRLLENFLARPSSDRLASNHLYMDYKNIINQRAKSQAPKSAV